MKMIEKDKQFDAVKMMREIRDKVSAETQNMILHELKKYIDKKKTDSNWIPLGK